MYVCVCRYVCIYVCDTDIPAVYHLVTFHEDRHVYVL